MDKTSLFNNNYSRFSSQESVYSRRRSISLIHIQQSVYSRRQSIQEGGLIALLTLLVELRTLRGFVEGFPGTCLSKTICMPRLYRLYFGTVSGSRCNFLHEKKEDGVHSRAFLLYANRTPESVQFPSFSFLAKRTNIRV